MAGAASGAQPNFPTVANPQTTAAAAGGAATSYGASMPNASVAPSGLSGLFGASGGAPGAPGAPNLSQILQMFSNQGRPQMPQMGRNLGAGSQLTQPGAQNAMFSQLAQQLAQHRLQSQQMYNPATTAASGAAASAPGLGMTNPFMPQAAPAQQPGMAFPWMGGR